MSEVVFTPNAPAPIGPYSQAIQTGRLLFVSGQIPVDAATSKVVDGDVAAQARQCLKNMKAVLDEAGASVSNVVKTTIFLVDMADFAAVNAVYKEFFEPNAPARSCIAVQALPLGVRVEIEAIADLTSKLYIV